VRAAAQCRQGDDQGLRGRTGAASGAGALDRRVARLSPLQVRSISAIAASAGIGLEDKGVYISPWQWSFGAQYEFDLGKAGTIIPRIDVNHEDAFERNANNVDAATGGKDIFGVIPSRTLVNARVAYATAEKDWELAVKSAI
jgi:hypothetical protein